MSLEKDWEFETKSIHSGFIPVDKTGATSFPLYETASFAHPTAEDIEAVFEGKKFGYVYSRIGNPTVSAFENRINALENGKGAVATSSGMSAIANVIFALAGQGDEIVASKSLFGGTFLLFQEIVGKLGIKVNYVAATDISAWKKAVTEKTKLFFVETLGNPKLDVPDIKALSALSRTAGIPLVIDGTLTTPYLFDARGSGADIIVHSTTKYLCGHGSAIGGVFVELGNFNWKECRTKEVRELTAKAGDMAFLYRARKQIFQNLGNCLSPFNAFLQGFGLETLSLRMERHCQNAAALAAALEKNGKVKDVNYPGLSSSPYREIAAKQFNGKFGGLLTIRLGSREKSFKFINNLKMAKNLANLGDAKTLVIHPDSTIYHECSAEEKKAAGVTDDLVRVSVGIENIKDIVGDFEQALEGV